MSDLESMTSWQLADFIAGKLKVYCGNMYGAEAYRPLSSLPFYRSDSVSSSHLLSDLVFDRYGRLGHEEILERIDGVVTEMEQLPGVELDPEDYMRFLEACEIQTPDTWEVESAAISAMILDRFGSQLEEAYGSDIIEQVNNLSGERCTDANRDFSLDSFPYWIKVLPSGDDRNEIIIKLEQRHNNREKNIKERLEKEHKDHQRTALIAGAVKRVTQTRDVTLLNKLAACFVKKEGGAGGLKEGGLAGIYAASVVSDDVDILPLLGAIEASFSQQYIWTSGLENKGCYRAYAKERDCVTKAFYGLESLLVLTHHQIPSLAEKARDGAMEAFVIETVVAPDFQKIQEAVLRFSVKHAGHIQEQIEDYKCRQIDQRRDNRIEEVLRFAAKGLYDLSEFANEFQGKSVSDIEQNDLAAVINKLYGLTGMFEDVKASQEAAGLLEQFDALGKRAKAIAEHGRNSLGLRETSEATLAGSVGGRKPEV